MGVYYYGVSKSTRKINGEIMPLLNFWGKAPSCFYRNDGRFQAFISRSDNNAFEHAKSGVKYAMDRDFFKNEEGKPEANFYEMKARDGVYHDGTLDSLYAGKIIRIKPGQYEIKWAEKKEVEAS